MKSAVYSHFSSQETPEKVSSQNSIYLFVFYEKYRFARPITIASLSQFHKCLFIFGYDVVHNSLYFFPLSIAHKFNKINNLLLLIFR